MKNIDLYNGFGKERWFSLEDLPGEIWKSIPEIGEKYRISSWGRIKSSGNYKCQTYKILKPQISWGTLSHGYISIPLIYNGIKSCHYIHRLIARAFIPNPKNLPQVNHINGIKWDNRIENLEWCTAKENATHALQNRLKIPSKGENHYKTKLTTHQVLEIRKKYNTKTGKTSEMIKESSTKYQTSYGCIKSIVYNQTWKHLLK